ncbi:MAG: hypothetical protein J6567_02535 [Gilliamella sp.]|uniref:STY0301 family protein n=1 Tax=Gilliamella sp. TaxID=1891236 RepID=UPI0025D1F595|nr:STY0301 family protein [Gilliamella sp.]MCO6536823.1 hypothetical protein [Gilliamella sp.]
MKDKIFTITVILLAGFGMSFSVNAIYEITCPDSVQVKSIPTELEILPEGWQIFEQKNQFLQVDDGEVYSGKPVNLGQMIPFTITINGKKYKHSWHVDTSYNTSNDTGYWFNCSYSFNRVRLIKRIDSNMKTCWVITSKDAKGKMKVKLNCDKKIHEGPQSFY